MGFNSEPNNLTNLNRFKDSGLANERGVTMALKSSKRQRQIAKNSRGVAMKGSFKKVAKAITKATSGSYYRSDLSNAALARWCKIWKSQEKYHAAPKSE